MADRDWSQFEMQTFLALIAKSVHTNGAGKKPNPNTSQVRVDFATAFNESLNRSNQSQDVEMHEILDKLDELLIERKHIVGAGGLLERSRASRITRSMTIAFRRRRAMDFDGSKAEWERGRNKEVVNKDRVERGLDPLPDSAFERPSSDKIEVRASNIYPKYAEVDPGQGDTARAPQKYEKSRLSRTAEKTKRKAREARPVVWGSGSDDGEIAS